MRSFVFATIALFIGSFQAGTSFADSSLLPQELAVSPAFSQEGTQTPWSQSLQMLPFVQAASGMRLTGEDDSRRLSFYLASGQAMTAGTLRIAYKNAVSVLPDGAALSIAINGRSVSSVPIRSPQGVTLHEFKVEPAMLHPGWNTATLRARQHHRVDCSIEAVYELWTQIDPVQSGFVTEAKAPADDPAILMSAGRADSGLTELRVIVPASSAEAMARQSLPVMQSLALLLGRDDLKVIFTDAESGRPGIDLYMGDPASKLLSREARSFLAASPDGFSLQDLGHGRIRVVLRGASEQTISAALVRAINGPFQPVILGAKSLRENATILADKPGRTSLEQLGHSSEPFAGRLFRTSVDIVMPEDFYPGDYAAVTMRLNAATAPKLSPGAQLLVRVNEKAVTSHGLYAANGATLRDRPIDISLRAFHPGINKVDIVAELPREDDKVCGLAHRDEDRPRFLLLSETTFDIPALARAGRLPDLAAFAGRGYPFNQPGKMQIFVDRASPARLSAAATILTRLALSAQHPVAADLHIGTPGPDFEATALVISAGDQRMTELSGESLRSARLAKGGFDALTTGSVNPAVNIAGAGVGSEMQTLLDAFQERTADDRDTPSATARLLTQFQRASDIVGSWLEYRDVADHSPHLMPSEILTTIMQTGNGARAYSTTTISAPNEGDLEQGVDALTERSVWTSLRGEAAYVRRSDLSVVTVQPKTYSFYPLTDTSPGNLRRLGAAWLSDHFLIYVGLVLLLIGSFGLWLGYTIPRKGVRTVA
ncbi:MAG: cellulose biosynthesis cyclic di-GMP-binding regulatory protein BcsB [Allorhizobium sp.]